MRETNKAPSLLKQAMSVNRRPFPWVKAFFAGVAASLPVLIGLLFGNLEYGLIAGMGGFTFLYFFNIPHAQNAKKLFFVVLGMTLVSALGTLCCTVPARSSYFDGDYRSDSYFYFWSLTNCWAICNLFCPRLCVDDGDACQSGTCASTGLASFF